MLVGYSCILDRKCWRNILQSAGWVVKGATACLFRRFEYGAHGTKLSTVARRI